MCKVHRNLYNNSLKFPSKIIPKSTLNRSRKPSKTNLRKNVQNNSEKSKKGPKMVSKGGSQGDPRMWFWDTLGVLGPPGRHHGSQTSPQGPPDPSKHRFLMVLGPILYQSCYDFDCFLGPVFVDASERVCDFNSTW